MIDRPTIAKIMDATKIEEVVSEFVTLKKRGINYVGLCPFHNDSNPSFSVSPTRGICHCFTCGKGGNAINFLMELEQMTYPDALRWLAKKYKIEIQERELTNEEKQRESERESMFIVNDWAAKYFQDILLHDVDGIAIGMAYFRGRGFRDDIIRKFQLGFALPKRTALAEAAKAAGYNPKYLVDTGLCFKVDKDEAGNKSGEDKILDRFSGRAIFPWFSVSGKVVAFGGRVLDSRTKGVSQKYVNSPDSVIYHKERELYGLYQAKKAIAKEDCVFMVEGYTDVISMHQCGIENVVANSGTALSVHQIRLLHRFTSNIVLLYDGDNAGIHAALRGTDMLLEEEMNVKVLFLPDGNDPDSFARSHSAEEFRRYIQENQTDFIQFKTDILLRGVTDPVKRSQAINSIVESISKIKNQITRASYITDCSHRLGVNEAIIVNALNNFVRNGMSEQVKAERRAAGLKDSTVAAAQQAQSVMRAVTPLDKLLEVEGLLVQLIIHHGDQLITVQDVDGNDVEVAVAQYISLDLGGDGFKFHNDLYNQIMQEAVEHLEKEDDFVAETYFANHPNPEISRLAGLPTGDQEVSTASLQMKMSADKLRQFVFKDILSFRTHYIAQRIIEVQQEFARNPTNRELLQEFMKLKQMNTLLASQANNIFN
ncbi:DNA primase [Segatella copri]|uniref:DNA primase n=1 Tax=Segatella copri DSM 18205 TaxID=537011 RepID=D1PAY5_9BACT|nr:DNA primase [Segatella copri]EFB35942.1 DNA primase [Segatella copri DSM 18205]MCW4096433.1 DNA primase [Segatella copri]MQP19414.1 DNA primase [Segatella copri DSM 18205]UEA44049.1 DNA primase [Segatella copri DSM 18205]UWP51336.1 DNA primase [Segatella copri DSM 18205]